MKSVIRERVAFVCSYVKRRVDGLRPSFHKTGGRPEICVRHQSHTHTHTYRDGELPHLTDSPVPIRCCWRGTELSYGEVI